VTYLIQQILLCLAATALFFFALGWLTGRWRAAKKLADGEEAWRRKMADVGREEDQLRGDYDAESERRIAAETTLEETQAHVKYLEASLDDTQTRLKELVESLAAQVGAYATLQTESESLRERLAELESETPVTRHQPQ